MFRWDADSDIRCACKKTLGNQNMLAGMGKGLRQQQCKSSGCYCMAHDMTNAALMMPMAEAVLCAL